VALQGGKHRCARSNERIEHVVTIKGKHANKSARQLEREWSWVVTRGCSCQRPNLPEPLIEVTARDFASATLFVSWLAISTRFSLH
jgi:hypothetical protein